MPVKIQRHSSSASVLKLESKAVCNWSLSEQDNLKPTFYTVCTKHRMEYTLISPVPLRSSNQVTFVKRIQTRKTLRKQYGRWVELITK